MGAIRMATVYELPHLHSLIILEDEFELKTINQINQCISCEIPNKVTSLVLHDRVMQ